MHVGVDQPGQHRPAGEVDDVRVGHVGAAGLDGPDAVALHEDRLVVAGGVAQPVDEPAPGEQQRSWHDAPSSDPRGVASPTAP